MATKKTKGTLLVVDDNRNILTAVRMLAVECFETVACICNPNNIPARLREERPDVVLLDMNFQSGINNGNEGLFWLREIKRVSGGMLTLRQDKQRGVVTFDVVSP